MSDLVFVRNMARMLAKLPEKSSWCQNDQVCQVVKCNCKAL